MKTDFEDISPVKKKIFVEIEPNEVERKLDLAYRTLGKRAKIPGFRQGKIPRNILERHFGNQVIEDCARELISETFPQAINEMGAFPLGSPLLEKENLKQGQPFKYTAVMEIRPQFEVKDYLGLEVQKEILSVDDEDVLKQLEHIRESNGKLNSIEEDRPAKKDDFLVIEYEGFENDAPMEGIKASNFMLKIGSGNFHPRFEESLIGLKNGDETEITVDFEESYYHSKLAGKKVRFNVKVIDIKEMILPDLDDKFAANLGAELKSLDELKSKIRENLTAQEDVRIDKELKHRLLESISQTVDIELPDTLIEAESSFALENIKENFRRSGSSLEKAGLSEEKLLEDFRPASERRVKHMLVLGQIAAQEKLSVTEEDLDEGYRDLSARMGQDSETIKKYYEARNIVDSLKEKLLEEKTLNYLVEHARISEVNRETLEKLEPEEEK